MISTIPKWLGDLFEGSLRPNVTVLTTSSISAHIKIIRFQGDLSKWNFQIGYAHVIRVSDTEYRNYTVAHYDIKAGVFDVVFHLHGNGVGCQYIDALERGDEIYISSPRGHKVYDPGVQKQVIFGDETSLGLACSFLSVLKNHQYQFYFELDKENINVPQLLGIENCTVFPRKGLFLNEKWINDLPVFNSGEWKDANFILTGNVNSVRTFRKVVKTATKGKVFSQGYWLEGKKGL